MATRTAYAGTITAGTDITAANNNKLPGGWIALDESTAGGGPTSGTTELTLHTLSVPVGASRKLRIHFHAPKVTFSVSSDDFAIRAYYDGGAVGRTTDKRSATAHETGLELVATCNTTTSGNKTIAITVQRTAGTGTWTCSAAATAPMFMLVEDIGPSS